MQAEGTKINQQPELSLSAEIEPFAKGGWKTTIRASVRTFDGKHEDLYDQLSMMLANGLDIAAQAIKDHEKERYKELGTIDDLVAKMKKEGATNDQ